MKHKTERASRSIFAVRNMVDGEILELPSNLRPLYARLRTVASRLEALQFEEFSLSGDKRRRTMQGRMGADTARWRDRLREDFLIPLGRAGKKLLKHSPGSWRAFETPPKRSTAEVVVASARAMAKASRAHWKLFVEVGFARNFAARMLKAANELEQRSATGVVARRERSRVLREIEGEVRKGRAILDLMDGLMIAHGREDEVLLSTWKRSKRIPGRIGRPRAKQRRRASPTQPATME
jgi:hypothetical protein